MMVMGKSNADLLEHQSEEASTSLKSSGKSGASLIKSTVTLFTVVFTFPVANQLYVKIKLS